jgi:hypothetical protein
MRTCPICDSPKRELIVPKYDSKEWELFRCECEMLYADSMSATEQTVNNYYLTNYQSNDGAPADLRLDSLAVFIRKTCLPPMMDVGGTDGKLASRVPMDVSGAGDDFTKQYSTFVLSHTLEHVYNVSGMIENIKRHIMYEGLVVVEVPIWKVDENHMKYDYHHQHINKFAPDKLEELFVRHGFSIELSGAIPFYIEYNCWRLVARCG